jgi:cystathionine gamma-synthase
LKEIEIQKTALAIRVISQQPPGGRCTLYASYAEVLASLTGARVEVVFTTLGDAHGAGFPSLLLDGAAVPPADLLAALAKLELDDAALLGLAEALEAPLERMLDSAG